MENHTAKHFILQLGSLASLYLSIGFFLTLIFGLINVLFPDSLDSYWQAEQAASSIRIGFAMVLVFFPTYLILTRLVNNNRRESNDTSYLTLTKWLIYLSLLVSGAILLGDLVAIIIGFLEGELTIRFILKALAVFVITGAAFYYYVLDARGHWITHQAQSKLYALITSIIVFSVLATSLMYIQTPSEVREMRADQDMIRDLQDMQWRIQDFAAINETLPESLAVAYGVAEVPTPPENEESYVYEVTGEDTYRICATFNRNMRGSNDDFSNSMIAPQDRAVAMSPEMRGNYNWDYQAGYWCFDRVVEEYQQ